jgi:hypothetical protein
MLIVLVCLGVADAAAADRSLLILNEKGETGAVAGRGTLFARVAERLGERLDDAGYRVLGLEGAPQDDAVPGSGAGDPLASARAIAPDADLVTIMDVLVDTAIFSRGTTIQVRLTGRVVELATSNVMFRFDVGSPRSIVAPVDCDINCVVSTITDHADELTVELGDAIAERLRNLE